MIKDKSKKAPDAARLLPRRRGPDLATEQRCCDFNYLCLHRLLNGFRDAHVRVLYAPGARPNQEVQLRIHFVKRHRYTNTLRIELLNGGHRAEEKIVLIVQAYKDLRCAEVVRCNGRHLQARYPAVNARMFSPNEKSQMNRLLGEWFRRCMKRGYIGEVIPREA